MSESKCGCCGGGNAGSSDIKETVKEWYRQAAVAADTGKSSCCCSKSENKPLIPRNLYSDAETQGLPLEAVLASLGCANPTALANLQPGEVVLDLGSGGGIDVLLSARRVGPTGKAYGLDMTDEMLDLARKNQAEAGVENVEFLKGEIENIPLPDDSIDTIISNCVINLSVDKDKVLKEAYRVLKPGGQFAVADIVLVKSLSELAKKHLGLWAGCVAGALEVDDYKNKLRSAGFTDVEIEIVKGYSLEDPKGLDVDDLISELGHDGAVQLMGSFVSAFIRARK